MRQAIFNLFFYTLPITVLSQVNADFKVIKSHRINKIYEFFNSDTSAVYIYDSSGCLRELIRYERLEHNEKPVIKKSVSYNYLNLVMRNRFWVSRTEFNLSQGKSLLLSGNFIDNEYIYNVSDIGKKYYLLNYEERNFYTYSNLKNFQNVIYKDTNFLLFSKRDASLTVYNPKIPAVICESKFNYNKAFHPVDSLLVGDSVITSFWLSKSDGDIVVLLGFNYIKRVNNKRFMQNYLEYKFHQPVKFVSKTFVDIYEFCRKEIYSSLVSSNVSLYRSSQYNAMVRKKNLLYHTINLSQWNLPEFNATLRSTEKSLKLEISYEPSNEFYTKTINPPPQYKYVIVKF